MTQETRRCQHCKEDFIIEAGDFDFYKKIDMPPPTWCSKCRTQRRYTWRNERVLYKRNCDLCHKGIVTIYSPDKPYKVYCQNCWWSDGWSSSDYGRDFDFSRSFFDQFRELQLAVPRIALLSKNSINSEYTNHANNNKNCYLSFSVVDSENIYYSTNVWESSRDCVDCYRLEGHNELLYECVDCINCYKCQYLMLSRDSRECLYSFDLRNCSNCFLSFGLRNKEYCILNQQYSKDQYKQKIQEYRLSTHQGRQRAYQEWRSVMKQSALHKYAVVERSEEATGNMIMNSKNALNVFDVSSQENTKNIIVSIDCKDSMDSYHYGFRSELVYESHGVIHSYDMKFTHLCYDNSSLAYCDTCHNSENLFGCVGIKKGSYCILNKKYDENSYRELKERIITQMKESGEYGEFFPIQHMLFGYNETQAQVYMPLSKTEALVQGWQWQDNLPGIFNQETISAKEISEDIANTDFSILNEIIACEQCSKNFRLTPYELDFYKKENIPIPHFCPDCRYHRKIQMRLPRQLWLRNCACSGKESRINKY